MPTGVYVRTEEYRRRMSKAMTGIKHSDEMKRKMSETMKGRPSHRKGKHLTEAHKSNLSKAMKGRFTGPDSFHWRGGILKDKRRNMGLIETFRAQSSDGIIRCHFCGEEVVKLEGKTGDSIHIHSLDGNHENWDPVNKVPLTARATFPIITLEVKEIAIGRVMQLLTAPKERGHNILRVSPE